MTVIETLAYERETIIIALDIINGDILRNINAGKSTASLKDQRAQMETMLFDLDDMAATLFGQAAWLEAVK